MPSNASFTELQTKWHKVANQVAAYTYILKSIGRMHAYVTSAEYAVIRAAKIADRSMHAQGSKEDLARLRGEAMVAIAKAKVVATKVALEVCQDVFQICGTRATLRSENMDRFWRDVRTLSLHDPVDYKSRLLGEYYLQDRLPTPSILT